MATVQFTTSAKIDKTSGKYEVLVRFYHGKINQRAKTNVFVNLDYWDSSKQCNVVPRVRLMNEENKQLIHDLTEQNKQLDSIRSYISQSFIESGAGKVDLPAKWLVAKMAEYTLPKSETPSNDLFDIYKSFIEGHHVTSATRRGLFVAYRELKRYDIYTDSRLSFDNITKETLDNFRSFLLIEHTLCSNSRSGLIFADPKYKIAFESVEGSKQPKPRGRNIIYLTMSRLRTFIIWAIDNGYMETNPFRGFDMGSEVYGDPIYITIDERKQLYNCDMSHRPQLAKQRDIFVFQCMIGCRVGDLLSMTKDNVINGAIEYIPRKTKEGRPITVRVPLNDTAKEILERYADTPGDKLLPFISSVNYNLAIKEFFKLAELNRMVTIVDSVTGDQKQVPLYMVASSHMARRTFAGNLYNQVQDPNLISKVTGHVEGSRAFNRYRKIEEETTRKLVSLLD